MKGDASPASSFMRTIMMPVSDAAFAELMKIAGRDLPGFVEINTQSPALKTRFYAGEASAAAIAAGGVVAADIWNLRSGQPQTVSVGTREAAAGLIGFMYQKFHDPNTAPPARDRDDSFIGFYETKDNRHIYLHPSFPESARRLIEVLGCTTDKTGVAAAVKNWMARDLEDAVARARACGGIARAPEEWDATEQGRCLAGRPCVEVVKIAESPPEDFPAKGVRPLSGIRVLDLTRVLAGPTCARTLAQYGAEAMRIGSKDLPSVPAFVADTGHGKLSAFVNLKTEMGRQHLQALVRQSDVFSQSYRTGTLERLGFGPVELARLRPGIIYTSINCYGHEGPWRNRAGWEQLAQTVTGVACLHGGADGPRLLPAAVTDYITGFLAAFGSLVALKHRALYGGSYLVRVALSQTAMWLRSLGLAGSDILNQAKPLNEDEIQSFSISSDTGFGPMTHLRPPVGMSATPTRWERGVVPLGTHDPVWPENL